MANIKNFKLELYQAKLACLCLFRLIVEGNGRNEMGLVFSHIITTTKLELH